MYTDTKNMSNNVNNVDMTYSRLQATKSKGRLGKVWKPLLRLINHKTETLQNCSNKHPNNIGLNNMNNNSEVVSRLQVDLPPKILSSEEESSQLYEQDYSRSTTVKQEEIAFIKSASIEKSSTHYRAHCIYGRNCQDTLHEHTNSTKVLVPATSLEQMLLHTSACNGSLENIDEELLNAWYHYHYQQFPIEASLC